MKKHQVSVYTLGQCFPELFQLRVLLPSSSQHREYNLRKIYAYQSAFSFSTEKMRVNDLT